MYNRHTLKTVLNRLTDTLRKEPNVEGVLLVGSGVKEFTDDWADLDLLVVVETAEKTREVWESLNQKVKLLFEVYRLDGQVFGEESYLSRILLTDFMEIDLGVVSLGALSARKEAWKVLFENSSRITEQMAETWRRRKTPEPKQSIEQSINSIWFHLKNAAVAIKRSDSFRAAKEMEIIRNEAVAIWSQHEDKSDKYFREVSRMRSDFRRKLAETYHGGVEREALVKGFTQTFNFYFWVLKEIDQNNQSVAEFEKRMQMLVREMELEKTS